MINKKFTLIELIVVISILGILASIIIPNVSNFKNEALEVSYNAEVKNIQTAVDIYKVKNRNKIPVLTEVELNKPAAIDFEVLAPKYLRKKPKDGFYWIDNNGQVWGSSIDAPTGFNLSGTTLNWTPLGAEDISYKIYGINSTGAKVIYKLVELGQVKNINTFEVVPSDYEAFLISSIDQYGNESGKVGVGYKGIAKVNDNPDTDSKENEPVLTTYNIGDESLILEEGWIRYEETHPDIIYTGTYKQHPYATLSGGYEKLGLMTYSLEFEGSAIRLSGNHWTGYSRDIRIKIDGKEVYAYSMGEKITYVTSIYYQNLDLGSGKHLLEVYNTDGKNFVIDCIDIHK